MHCEQAEMMLAEISFGEADLQSKAHLDLTSHLATCERCREQLGDMRLAAKLLTEGVNSQVEPVLSRGRMDALLALDAEDAEANKGGLKSKVFQSRLSFKLNFETMKRPLAVAACVALMATALVPTMMVEWGRSDRNTRSFGFAGGGERRFNDHVDNFAMPAGEDRPGSKGDLRGGRTLLYDAEVPDGGNESTVTRNIQGLRSKVAPNTLNWRVGGDRSVELESPDEDAVKDRFGNSAVENRYRFEGRGVEQDKRVSDSRTQWSAQLEPKAENSKQRQVTNETARLRDNMITGLSSKPSVYTDSKRDREEGAGKNSPDVLLGARIQELGGAQSPRQGQVVGSVERGNVKATPKFSTVRPKPTSGREYFKSDSGVKYSGGAKLPAGVTMSADSKRVSDDDLDGGIEKLRRTRRETLDLSALAEKVVPADGMLSQKHFDAPAKPGAPSGYSAFDPLVETEGALRGKLKANKTADEKPQITSGGIVSNGTFGSNFSRLNNESSGKAVTSTIVEGKERAASGKDLGLIKKQSNFGVVLPQTASPQKTEGFTRRGSVNGAGQVDLNEQIRELQRPDNLYNQKPSEAERKLSIAESRSSRETVQNDKLVSDFNSRESRQLSSKEELSKAAEQFKKTRPVDNTPMLADSTELDLSIQPQKNGKVTDGLFGDTAKGKAETPARGERLYSLTKDGDKGGKTNELKRKKKGVDIDSLDPSAVGRWEYTPKDENVVVDGKQQNQLDKLRSDMTKTEALKLQIKRAAAESLGDDVKSLDKELEAIKKQKQDEIPEIPGTNLNGPSAAKRDAVINRDEEDVKLPSASAYPLMPVNPFVMTAKDRLSTFGLDVDTASYTMARRFIKQGYLPPAGSVRMEEFVNAFDYNYGTQSSRTFAIDVAGADSPFGKNLTLVRVGVKAKVVGRDGRKPVHAVLVVDASGSMDKVDRLPLVKHAIGLMVNELQPTDRVSLITYGSRAQLVLQAHAASDKQGILAALNSIQASGSTNMIEALNLGYDQARSFFEAGHVNRVMLCSDGVANIGETDAEKMLKQVNSHRAHGITFSSIGFGLGVYNDALLEKLANRGDGVYSYIDSKDEAKRVFVDGLTATLQTVAKDAKIQVDFNPNVVRRYRLVGYENRAIADKDFRNDTIDAGEVGSGQSSTALYEVELHDQSKLDLGTVYVRYRNADTNEVEEISQRLSREMIAKRTPGSDPYFYLAACSAEFAEILRGSEHAAGSHLQALEAVMKQVSDKLPLNNQAKELHGLIKAAIGLPKAP